MNRRLESGHVLLVEDDASRASMVADFLAPHGFAVAIEGRGDTAAQRIIDENPDVVILDVSLPGLDGFSVCRAVRSGYRGAIIMLTARGEEVDEVLGFEAGADDYLAKPVRPLALLARLRTHLRRATPADDEERRQRLQALDAATEELDELVGELLRYVRMETTQPRFDLEQIA